MARSISSKYGARLVDNFECVFSVLLAILFAHWIGASHASWAAFSGYMVMRGHVRESMVRGTMRVIGTIVGAGVALTIIPFVTGSWWFSSIAIAVIGGTSLYGAMTQQRSYAWWLYGLTFSMILMDKLQEPEINITVFTTTRVIEVLAGTAACLVVSSLSTMTLRRKWPATPSPMPAQCLWRPVALRHAAQCGVALGLLPIIQHYFQIRDTSQSAISIMAVMMVPVTSIRASGLGPVSKKIGLRVIGCVGGALMAGIILQVAHQNPVLLMMGTAAGVFVGRHIENGKHSIIYLGTQFTLAVLVTLVPDNYDQVALAPAMGRLFGILIGLAVIEPVLVIWHVARSKLAARTIDSVVFRLKPQCR